MHVLLQHVQEGDAEHFGVCVPSPGELAWQCGSTMKGVTSSAAFDLCFYLDCATEPNNSPSIRFTPASTLSGDIVF